MALNSTSPLLPPMLVLAMARQLGVRSTFVAFHDSTAEDDGALVYLKSLSETSEIQLLRIETQHAVAVHDGLIADPFGLLGSSENLAVVNPGLFSEHVHYLSSVSCPENCPHGLRFDSNFYTLETNAFDQNVTLIEWYKVKDKLFYETIYYAGRVDQGRIEITPEKTAIKEKWERRSLQGTTLKVSTLPWATLVTHDGRSYDGFVPEVLYAIQRRANFSIEWTEPSDRKYGALDIVNGLLVWNGLVGMAHRKETDLVAAGLSITRERSNAVTFTQPYAVFISTLIIVNPTYAGATPGDQVNLMAFMNVFSVPAWTVLIATLIVQILLGTMFFLRETKISLSVGCSLSYVLRALFKLSHPLEAGGSPGSLSSKIFVMTIALLGLMFMVCYEGMLTSFMTHQMPMPALREFEDALDQGYQVIVLQDSSHEVGLRSSPQGSGKLKVYQESIRDNPKALYSSVTAMQQAMLANPKLAQAGADVSVGQDSRFLPLRSMVDVTEDLQSFAFPIDSDLISFFNYQLIKLYNSGVIDFLSWKWFDSRTPQDECKCPTKTETVFALGYENLALPAIIFSSGVIAALVIMAFENWHCCPSKHKNQRNFLQRVQ